jgi:hypothetical protein
LSLVACLFHFQFPISIIQEAFNASLHPISFILNSNFNTTHSDTSTTNTIQLALPNLLQRPVGYLPAVDPLGSVRRYELGYVAGGNGGFGELFEEG